jgi:hypothetical protein
MRAAKERKDTTSFLCVPCSVIRQNRHQPRRFSIAHVFPSSPRDWSGERIEERIPRTNSRIAPLNRSSRRESALTLFGIRWSGLTSAATRFMGRGIPASCRKRAPQPSPPWHGGEEFLVAATPRCVLSRPILLQENKDLQDCSTDEHGLDSAAGQRCYRKVGLFILF